MPKRGQVNTIDLALGVMLFILALTLLYHYLGGAAREMSAEQGMSYEMIFNNLGVNLEQNEFAGRDFLGEYKIFYENLSRFGELSYDQQRRALFENLLTYVNNTDFCIYLLDKDDNLVPVKVSGTQRNGIGDDNNDNMTLGMAVCGGAYVTGPAEENCRMPPYTSGVLVTRPVVLTNHETEGNKTVRLNVLVCEK